MRRIHSVVIALALTEPLLISKFENASFTTGADELRRPTDKESFMRMLSHYEIGSQNGVPQRCANQNECDAARGCGA
jgi:hypothetical protein